MAPFRGLFHRYTSSCRVVLTAGLLFAAIASPAVAQSDPTPPASPVRLVFIHHSTGEGLLNPEYGGLLPVLNRNNYYLTDTNYDWGPYDNDVDDGANIGSHTDLGHWYNWFLGPDRDTYLQAVYDNPTIYTGWTNSDSIADPGGENRIVLFKSCFTAAQGLSGNPDDPPLPAGTPNPLYGIGAYDDPNGDLHSVANVKGLYRDLLEYFASRPDKLFGIITTPPSFPGAADESMPRLRGINSWLIEHLLDGYALNNVFVFDYGNVLTSNGGGPETNDLGWAGGSHHRFRSGSIEHLVGPSDFLAYPSWDSGSSSWDNHPSMAGQEKAAAEFVPLLNVSYNRWRTATDARRLDDAARPSSLAVSIIGPHPADGGTLISVTGPAEIRVRLTLHDVLGCEVRAIAEQRIGEAPVFIRLDTYELADGTYFIRCASPAGVASTRLSVLHR